jgi:hypothetical protein
MVIMAIDPGPIESAWVTMQDSRLLDHAKNYNDAILGRLRLLRVQHSPVDRLVIEMIQSYGSGMAVGKSTFDTCVWIGRFMEAWGAERTDLVYRPTVKTHICGNPKAKDSNVRMSLLDRYGGVEAIRKGGPLYKVTADQFSALAVAIYWQETHNAGSLPNEREQPNDITAT